MEENKEVLKLSPLKRKSLIVEFWPEDQAKIDAFKKLFNLPDRSIQQFKEICANSSLERSVDEWLQKLIFDEWEAIAEQDTFYSELVRRD